MKKQVVAKLIFGYDVEYMYQSPSLMPGLCDVCHNRLEDVPNMAYKMRKKKGDMFYTYDHYCIVTEKFKSFCDENHYPGLKFTAITASPGFYHFMPTIVYKLDCVRGGTRFMNHRECCGSYDEVIGMPEFKEVDFFMPNDDFICRSEHLFGTREKKSPLIIIGLDTMRKMKSYGLRGICYFDVYEYPQST